MANLPKERLTPEDPPFTTVGVDYFGPLAFPCQALRLCIYLFDDKSSSHRDYELLGYRFLY